METGTEMEEATGSGNSGNGNGNNGNGNGNGGSNGSGNSGNGNGNNGNGNGNGGSNGSGNSGNGNGNNGNGNGNGGSNGSGNSGNGNGNNGNGNGNGGSNGSGNSGNGNGNNGNGNGNGGSNGSGSGSGDGNGDGGVDVPGSGGGSGSGDGNGDGGVDVPGSGGGSGVADTEPGHGHNISFFCRAASLLRISGPGNNTTINFIPKSVKEAGSAMKLDLVNQTLWLNYTNVKPSFFGTRKISVSMSNNLPTGMTLTLYANTFAGFGFGQNGTPAGTVTLVNGQVNTLITGIGSVFTGRGVNNGHKLTYVLDFDESEYHTITSDLNQSVVITYTISDE